ncbi:hypothetical protein K502DRAFT_29466 [Neoconidiobolus thromboides FSU 785]|nr:hypothetical protein K502DRAFT_29466 [Neoconidiobolus thromboides FSU 785]
MVSNTSDIVQESNDMTNEGEKTGKIIECLIVHLTYFIVNASVSINDKELFIKDKKFNGENEINVENSNIKEAPQSISIGYSNILNDPEVMSKDEKNKSHEIKEYNNEKNDAQKHIEEEEINNGDIDDNEQKAVIEVENIEYSDSQGLAKVEEEMDEIIKKLKMEGENEKGIEIKQEKKEERIGTPTIKGILSKNKEIKEEKKQVSFINIPTEANTTFTSTVNTPSTIADHTPSEFYVKDNPKKWKKLALMVLREISNHRLAPLFQKPIKETVAPGYYDIVLEPIDLNKIARKIKEGVSNLIIIYHIFTLINHK